MMPSAPISWAKLAQGRSRHPVAVRSGSYNRYPPIGLLDDNPNPTLAFFVRHRREFARVSRADEPGRSRLDAKLHLAAKCPLIQYKVVSKRSNDNREYAVPILIHQFCPTKSKSIRTVGSLKVDHPALFCRPKLSGDLRTNGSWEIIDLNAQSTRLKSGDGLYESAYLLPGPFGSVYYT